MECIQIVCSSSSSSSSSSDSDSSEEEISGDNGGDIVDVLYARRKLDDRHILLVVQMLADEMFPEMPNPRLCIAHIDSCFTELYMNPPVNNDVRRRRIINHMATYFAATNSEAAAAVTVIPIHDADHWSLLIYFNEQGVFYCFDSLGNYHREYKLSLLRRLCNDNILVRLRETRVMWVYSRRQDELFECGQYVFMFLYSFLRQLIPPPSPPLSYGGHPLQQQQQQYRRRLVDNIGQFEHALSRYVSKHCRPTNRLAFLRGLIAWIHEKRNY